jgi:hypothetical protein
MFDMYKAWEGVELVRFIRDALHEDTLVKSWHIRVHGNFWVVGLDHEGSFLIPVNNQDTVYQALGLQRNIIPMLEADYGKVPVAFTLTMIPVNRRQAPLQWRHFA